MIGLKKNNSNLIKIKINCFDATVIQRIHRELITQSKVGDM